MGRTEVRRFTTDVQALATRRRSGYPRVSNAWCPLRVSARVLRGWRALQAAEYDAVGIDDPGWVFADAEGRPIHPHALSQTFERIARRAGVPVIRLHDLRHTHGTLLITPLFPVGVVHRWYIVARRCAWRSGRRADVSTRTPGSVRHGEGGVVGQVLRGGGLELGSLFDLYAERVGDVAQPGEAGRAVPVGFVPLDLLLGHPERVGELALRPSSGDPRLDQHGGQFGERGGGRTSKT